MLVELMCCLLLLLCIKKLIVSTPGRTRHQAAQWIPSSSLHDVPRQPFIPTASIALCRLTLTAPRNKAGFGKFAINRNTYGVTNRLAFSWKMMFQALVARVV